MEKTQPLAQNVKERKRRIRSRNLVLGFILAAFVILFYVVTLTKGVPILQRPM